MEKYKISIIIPVFNAEEYLESCIQSVLNQTMDFNNIELILVDDKSKDNSKNIILNYSNKYSNVKHFFLEENSGSASLPRNTGIKIANAPFIIFLDSDDELYKNYCEILYNAINSNDVDIVNCRRTSNLNNTLLIPKEISKITNELQLLTKTESLFVEHTVWGKIYRTSFLRKNNIKFLDMLYKDLVFSTNCTVKTKKEIITLPKYPGYIYFINNEKSVTHDVSMKTLNDFLKCMKLIYKLIKDNYSQEVINELLNDMINMVFFILAKLDDNLNGIKIMHEFEQEFPIKFQPSFMPFNIMNNLIKQSHFKTTTILIRLMSLFYNHTRLRNFLFMNYSSLKKIEEIDLKYKSLSYNKT